MKNKKRNWCVTLKDNSVVVEARNRGGAARKAFKDWISKGVIKSQPYTVDGFFKGITCEPV